MHPHKFAAISRVALPIILLSLAWASSAWAAEYQVVYKFGTNYGDGWYPIASLIFDASGNIYGTTEDGGHNRAGTVFKLTPKPSGGWTESVLYNFWSRVGDGVFPWAGLTFDAAGNLYGTTYRGGAYDEGTVFQLIPNPDGSWTESVIHDFNGVDGAHPMSGRLIFDAAGKLYGTTADGGEHGVGTAYQLVPNPDGTWRENILHSFGAGGGKYLRNGLVFNQAGDLYGSAVLGGVYGYGTVFTLVPNPDGSWTEQVIRSFRGQSDPDADLIFDAAGNLYGTTSMGGAYDRGTVYKLTHNPDGSWTKTKLHAFEGWDGAHPAAGLVLDGAGNLYGTTWGGGAYDSGTVFKLTPQPDGHWKLTKIHVFKYGQHPQAGLVMDAAGNLYGTARFGGLGYGVVFRITP
jgi:uncharacterized repeat protein (TIGR03803 family)